MKARSNYITYLTLKFFPVVFLLALVMDVFEEGSSIKDYFSLNYVIFLLILAIVFLLCVLYICEAVVSNEGVVLNQKIPLEWGDIEAVEVFQILGICYLKYKISKSRSKVALFPTERLPHEVYLGLKEDLMFEIISRAKKEFNL